MNDVNNIMDAVSEVEFGGRKFQFKYTLAGFAFLARKYGTVTNALALLDLDKIQNLEAGPIDALVDFIYAGIMWKDRNITPEDLAALISPLDMIKLPGIIADSMNKNFPQEKKEGEPENPTKAESK